MNRRKKIKQLMQANAKKASAKLAPANKNKYISKADRLKLAAEASEVAPPSSESQGITGAVASDSPQAAV
ncbi:DUF2986 domain-containing protein [Pseudomonas sp. LS-2]|jgi:hypothetical protein|uniref:DUF2986 domain-containing protein n=1 Tax=Pseudomonas sp. LS-2 TaxID=2315859 RepID=UPI000E74A403|nr:DUF2986 domain-containing protein [Pseudomonas sp. LS-2]RJX83293.1 DUF2986 domain-containing protein [Pseudomonas sp. LS-2]